MADYNVIDDVSSTLQVVLTDAYKTLQPAAPPVAEISDLQGVISTDPARVTLFLFEAVEDPSAKNRPRVRATPPPGPPPPPPNRLFLKKPPMALLLRYMLTPWSGDRLTDHKLLGRTFQVLYDGAILSGPQLQGGLAGMRYSCSGGAVEILAERRRRIPTHSRNC